MTLDVQIATDCIELPDSNSLSLWVELAIESAHEGAEVVVRVVDEAESAELNKTYRKKNGPTNVLSFPFEMPEGLPEEALSVDTLGDLVICAPVVLKEAAEQGKDSLAHWAHMVIHGCLHLQGYDHIEAQEAQVMEALEIKLLKSIGINNPYEGQALT